MKRWDQRPFEVRNLFNPAFCGLILFRAMQGYEEENLDGIPFSLLLLILPLCLHEQSRVVIAGSSRSYLLKTIEKNPQILIDFARRTTDMMPYALESLGFLLERDCFVVSDEGRFKIVQGQVRKLIKGTEESISCQRVARIVGKQFASIADRVTIYTTFGIRP
jgi:hypothetical protein